MNKLAFQIYGTKKATPFQSIWKTTENSAVGAELANTAATTPLPVGWAGTNLLTGGYTHTAGNTASLLVNNLTPTAGQSYQVICTLSGTGSVVINWGGVSSTSLSNTSTTITLTPINAAIKLSITPSSTFSGTVSLSIRQSSSAANQIQLPISIASGKSVWIDWGDGQYSTMNSANFYANRIHTYAASGEYPVRVFGDNFSFAFGGTNSVNDRLKIKSISSWGKLKLGVTSFLGCSNVTMSGITDIPDLTGVTDLSYIFQSCSSLTTVGRMNEWDTSSVISMSYMFRAATAFNQDLSSWDVNKVISFQSMFENALAFNNGSNENTNLITLRTGIDGWNINTTAASVTMSSMFNMWNGVSVFNRTLTNWNVSKVTNMGGMFAFGKFNNGFASGVANQLPWNTSSCTDMSSMFQQATGFNSNLGTGTTPWNVSQVTSFANMFASASKFNNGDEADITKSKINNWNIGGSVTSVSLAGMFNGASIFNRDVSNWNMTKVTATNNMFQNASAFNKSLSNWEREGSTMGNNTSTVSMFLGASTFNQPIDAWNTSSVTSMSSMFYDASAFNEPIGSWNVGNVTNMSSMFYNAIAFNQALDNWERAGSTTGNVTTMNGMFRGATTFNGLVDTWNVSKVTNMQAMFFTASRFNKPLANWERSTPGNTSTLANVTLFSEANIYVGMFGLATDFNQPIGNWNVSKVTRMNYMFRSATSFNQSIDAWDVSSVWDMEGMFNNASSFNKPLGSWNLSKISNMSSMFEGANAFNNGLAAGLSGTFTWNINTISDINMSRMFTNLGVFNQNIGAWNVSKVTNFTNFMLGKTPSTYSSTNLDAIYNGWIVNGVKPNISSPLSTNISFGTAKYSQAGKPGRDTLLANPNNWRIEDGLLTVSGTSNNGGLIRVTTTAAHGFTTGNSVYIYGVGGTTNANGTWTVTNVNTTVIELQGSTYNAAWTSGGNIILP